jgi:hypothetical protein
MAVSASTAEEISVGAGDVFYLDSAGAWQAVGATKDNNVFRVNTEYADIDVNGVIGPIKGIDYITNQLAELEVTGIQIGADKIALMIPGAASTTQTSADAGGGADTTLAAATVAGQYLAIKLTAVTGLVVGDAVRIGASGSIEYRTLTRVGTLGAGGTGVDLDFPLQAEHAALDDVVETDGAGLTIITPPIIRRLPTTAYHTWRLDVPGLDGRLVRFWVYDAIMTDNAEFEAADDDAMGPRLTLQSRIDVAQPNRGGWRIERVPAYATIAAPGS